ITTLSSAFMSSRRARTVRSVSLAVSCRETSSGLRRDARESACVCRGPDPFNALHSFPVETGNPKKHNYLDRFFLARRLRIFAAILRLETLFPRFLSLVFARRDLAGRRLRERFGAPRRLRNARSAVEDSGDLRPCRKAHTGAFRAGRFAAACSG